MSKPSAISEYYLILLFQKLSDALSQILPHNEIDHEPMCEKEEAEYMVCQNGGECLVNIIGETRTPLCKCPGGYTGMDCAQYAADILPSTQVMTSEMVIIIVICSFFLITAILITIFSIRKYRRYRQGTNVAVPIAGDKFCKIQDDVIAITNGNGIHNEAVNGSQSVIDMNSVEPAITTAQS